MLRKHQQEMANLMAEVINGLPVDTVIVKACPGAGKSAIPIIASKLIPAGLADALCWVCPRNALKDQGERNFMDPFFRDLIGHCLTVRASTNEPDPCRWHAGFITTYQAIGIDDQKTVLRDFTRKRYILVLDEFHHCEREGIWAEALAPLVARAVFRVFMTGTIQRGDDKQIAFIDYRQTPWGDFEPALSGSKKVRLIDYTRADALAEKAIIPLRFYLHDGQAEWIDPNSKKRTESLGKVKKKDAGAAIYTALSTAYANELLAIAFEHWLEHRRDFPGAKLLVVTANLKHAKAAADFLGRHWQRVGIATSHESKKAQETIKHFKAGRVEVLVSIAMAYEGLDVAEVSHIACLTHIRSVPWIEQMIGRAVRIDRRYPYEDQTGYIFAPDDPFFREIVDRIQEEQLPTAKVAREKEESGKQLSLFAEPAPKDDGANIYGIKPIGSRLLGKRELCYGLHAAAPLELPPTPSEMEAEIREKIEKHVRLFEFNNRHKPGKLNAEIKNHFGKARNEMTLAELERVFSYVKNNYPLNQIRGTGRPRVSTWAVPWP